MPTYFLSDVHLRLDRPERAERLRRFVARLTPADTLIVGGDLCDYYFAARQSRRPDAVCAGLEALAHFRAAGGRLELLAGNHDAWLEPFYRRVLGVGFVAEPWTKTVAGQRIHLTHGHLTGARPSWKGVMEGKTFFRGYAAAPPPVALGLSLLLDRTNAARRRRADQKHLDAFARYARGLARQADLVLFGHTHDPIDDRAATPRWCVLGGWHHQTSYLKVGPVAAELVVEPDPA